MATAVAAPALIVSALRDQAPGPFAVAGQALAVTAIGVCGWVLAGGAETRLVARPFCWCASAFALVALLGLSPGLLGDWVAWWAWPLFVVPLLTWLPLVFPDGRPPSRRWTWVFVVTAVAVVGVAAGDATSAHMTVDGERVANPTAAPTASTILGSLGTLAWLAASAAGIGALIVRWRRGDSQMRTRIGLVGAAMVVIALSYAAEPLLPDRANQVIGTLWGPALVGTIGFAVWRHSLWDIEPALRRTQVYALSVAALAAVYVAALAIVGLLVARLGPAESAAFALAVVVLAFEPVRRAAHRLVVTRLFGYRKDPIGAVSRIRQSTEQAGEPQNVLNALVAGVAESVRSPGVRLTLLTADDPVPVASTGAFEGRATALPLVYGAEELGVLEVSPRDPDSAWSAADERLLDHVAREAAATVALVVSRSERDAARVRLAMAEADRRAQTGRELHDGLGPVLAGSYLALQGLARQLEPGSENASRVEQISRDLKRAMAEVRRMIDGMQPGPEDAAALVEALEIHLAGIEHPRFDLAAHVCEVPTAVAGAAYLITMEAVTNVLRHAQANRATVTLTQSVDRLDVSVLDDGTLTSYAAGVGLRSMRARAAELGGTLTFQSTPHGTLLHACLPTAGDHG